jgi:hypothetical protein
MKTPDASSNTFMNSLLGDDTDSEKKTSEKLQCKDILIRLFSDSGIAKCPAVISNLDKFLQDPLSGKVNH